MKKSGSYYTPAKLSDFITQHTMKSWTRKKEIKILEPSCGEGIFIRSLQKYFAKNTNKPFRIDAVELNHDALQKVKQYSTKDNDSIQIHHTDFLLFAEKSKITYDLIIGNPPYITKKLLTKEQREQCRKTHINADLADKSINNIWTAFLIASTTQLNDTGILAFVLPAELLQVKFAEEIQDFLVNRFERLEIFTFSKIIFNNIEQDTILLFAYKKSQNRGIFFSRIHGADDLSEGKYRLKKCPNKQLKFTKWSNHILTSSEISFLAHIRNNIKTTQDYCHSVAGIVTAANNYFIVNETVVKKNRLQSICRPIIQKGLFVNGSVTFDGDDFDELKNTGRPCYLLCFSDRKSDKYSTAMKRYLAIGLEKEIHNRYKCKKRDQWHHVPSLWESEGFFFKRSHLYPKLLKNKTNTLVTDSAYRITMRSGYSINDLTYSFYNSLTLLFAELQGRYYGGGVLELTPNEFKSLPLPYVSISNNNFNDFEQRFKNKRTISDILEISDKHILKETLQLDDSSIQAIQEIRKKLIQRRLRTDKRG